MKIIKKKQVAKAEVKLEEKKYGVHIRMHMKQEEQKKERYKEVMKSIIKKWRKKYGIKEYIGCLESSEKGYLHVHMYVKGYIYVKEAQKDWSKKTGTQEGSLELKVVENEEHKRNLIKYIRKDPIIMWICKKYKEENGWKSGENPEKTG